MKILAVADEEAKKYYDYYVPGSLKDFDLIISCGDLKPVYMEFLVTMARCPVLFVHGNHDEFLDTHPPEGCDCIDDNLVVYNGVRILGLGGSYCYRKGKYMYSEKQMRIRILKLLPKILRNHGFDILVTHAPALGVNDFNTLSHRGFDSFNKLIERWKPKYFVHGHIHKNYGFNIPQRTQLENTTVINACEYCIFEYPEENKK